MFRSMPTNESPLLNEKARVSRVACVSPWCWIHASARSVTPAVRDRGPAVAPERLRPQAHARRGLAPLVLGAVDHRERAVDDLAVEAVGGKLLPRPVELDVRLEHAVEHGVRRQ